MPKILKNNIFREIVIVLLFVTIFFILTYPLVFNFTDSIVGQTDSDAPIFLWNAWQFGQDPFSLTTDNVLFPNESSLITHTYTELQSIVVNLFNLIFKNLVFSFNLVFLLLSVLSAYFAYKFLDLITKNKLASILGAVLFAFQSMWSIYVIFGTQNLLSLWFIPASLFFYQKYRYKIKWPYIFLSGLVLGLAFLNDFIIFIFTLAGLIVYGLLVNLFNKKRQLKYYVKTFFIFLVGALVLAGWKIVLILLNLSTLPNIPNPSASDVDFYHADIVNLIRPTQFHSLWSGASTWFTDSSLTQGNAFVGFSVLLVIILFIIFKIKFKEKIKQKKYLYIFIISSLVFVILSWGPYLHLFGYGTGIPLPSYWLQKIIPEINNLRMPMRWLMLANIFFAGIISLLLSYIYKFTNKYLKYIIFIIILVLLVIDVAFLPRDLIKVYGEETKILENFEQGTVLELPWMVSSGYFNINGSAKFSMLHQVIHQRPIIDGHLSRLPFSIQEEYQVKNLSTYMNDIYMVNYLVLNKELIEYYDQDVQSYVDFIDKNTSFSLIYQDEFYQIYEK